MNVCVCVCVSVCVSQSSTKEFSMKDRRINKYYSQNIFTLNYRQYIGNCIICIFAEAHWRNTWSVRPCYTYVIHLFKRKIIDHDIHKRLFRCILIGDAHIITQMNFSTKTIRIKRYAKSIFGGWRRCLNFSCTLPILLNEISISRVISHVESVWSRDISRSVWSTERASKLHLNYACAVFQNCSQTCARNRRKRESRKFRPCYL